MRITQVEISNHTSSGLKKISMDRLGSVVVLAGKNGSGKSRLLERISKWNGELALPFQNRSALKKFAADMYSGSLPKSWWEDPTISNIIKRARTSGWGDGDLPPLMRSFAEYYDVTFDSNEQPNIVHFVPKGLNLADPLTVVRKELINRADMACSVGAQNLQDCSLAYIQIIQDRWWNAEHPHSTIGAAEKREAGESYEKLKLVVSQFMASELSRDINGNATLFGFPIGAAMLSDGQKILLQLSVAIHAQAKQFSKLIILMDEPENHLHPGAMLDAIAKIEESLKDSQLWIATHSIPLLAHFEPDCIWWVIDGTVQHAGSQPEIVLRGLLGDDDRIDRLGDFLGLPSALAANNFAFQCLQPPAVLGTDGADPQITQIRKILGQYSTSGALRVLDFGAGRGRLVSALQETGSEIDYMAFDAFNEFEDECKVAIERKFGNSENRYFADEASIRSHVDSGSVDVVVMCNVLHEIDPIEWIKLFSQEGLIRHFLKPNGFLLLVEDLEMRVGEKAHQRGFLVLDAQDVKSLFSIKSTDTGFSVDDARNNGRLKAYLVPANCLGRISVETLKATLRQVCHLAQEEIVRLRGLAPSYREGRKHARFVHQLANATLALEAFGKSCG